MQIHVPNNLSRDQILGSLINDATFVFGDINYSENEHKQKRLYNC